MQTREGVIRLVASNIRRLRQKAGLTVEEAAARAGMPASYWLTIEAGEHDLDTEALANVSIGLGVEAALLL